MKKAKQERVRPGHLDIHAAAPTSCIKLYAVLLSYMFHLNQWSMELPAHDTPHWIKVPESDHDVSYD